MSIRVPLACYPGMNAFVRDWLAGDERFLRRGTPASPPADQAASRRLHDLFPTIHENATNIVAGQQVGFAGGPLYTLAKIASLLKLKRTLKGPVNAFFWLATEDHDFDEVAQLNVPASLVNRQQQLDLVKLRAVRAASKSVVGSLPIPGALIEQLLALFDMQRPSWLREGITFRDSFAELITSVCGDEIILVDALHPGLRRAGAPLFEQIRARESEIQEALHHRAQELEAAGYKEQVVPRDGDRYTLLFQINEDGTRTPSMQGTSTSALTRPLLQDFVLQPHVFVGGPAEIAYYAQIAPLHELLNVPMPRLALRGHVVVAPKRVVRAIERFGLDACSLFRSPDDILAEREPEGVARVREIADEAKRELMKRIGTIGEIALPADHSLAGSIQRSIGHLEYHFNKLSERAIKGLVRKDRERYTATRELVATLFPDRHVQDRVVSWFAYWTQYGSALLDRMVEEVEPDSDVFKIVDL
ncbi:MAG TPA: bacillithiol biosynthesis BshC [Thermoanaerobaculia bacterium]|nr:bacillithiol biosynthesis BshC [Thermoanaerobaculia bacterium]